MSTQVNSTAASLTPAARRILDVASNLFYQRGIRSVGVDLIAKEANVTKKTIYDRFGSKDKLIDAYLTSRDERWRALVVDRVEQQAGDPKRELLAIFDALDEWIREEDLQRGCSFINAYAELSDPQHPARPVIEAQKVWLRDYFRSLAHAAGVSDPKTLARQLLLLHEGAFVAYSTTDDADAVQAARDAASVLFENGLPTTR